MTITCSSDLTINTKNNALPAHSLSGNIEVSLVSGTVVHNQYRVRIRQADSTTMIPLEMGYSFKQFDPYLQVTYCRGNAKVVLNSGILSPSP